MMHDSERIEEIHAFVRSEKRGRLIARTIKLTLIIMVLAGYYILVVQQGMNVGNILKERVLPNVTPLISTLTSQVMSDVTKQMGLPPLPSQAPSSASVSDSATVSPSPNAGNSTIAATGSGTSSANPILQSLSPRQVQQLRTVLCQ